MNQIVFMVQTSLTRVICAAAELAARPILRDLGEIERLQNQVDTAQNFAQRTEQRVSEILMNELLRARPRFGYRDFLGKKSNGLENTKFIVTPINGRQNLARAIPHLAIMIGVAVEQNITTSVVFQPITNDFFWATKGEGAYHNKKWLKVSNQQQWAGSIIGLSQAKDYELLSCKKLPNKHPFYPEVANFRLLGAPALDLCYLAGGRLHGYIGQNISAFDLAPAMLIAMESAAQFSNQTGEVPKFTEFDNNQVTEPLIFGGNNSLKKLLRDVLLD